MIFGSAQDSYFTAEQAEEVKQAMGVREVEEEEERGVSTIYRGGTVFTHWRSPDIQSLEGSVLSPGEFSSLKLKYSILLVPNLILKISESKRMQENFIICPICSSYFKENNFL